MGSYDEVWERFASDRRLEFGGHRDPTWRDGHSFSASMIVPVEVSRFEDRLEPLRDALRPYPFVSLHPDRFMHVTLVMIGFLVPEQKNRGEVSVERLAEVEDNARRALANFPAFSARLANLNAFPGAAFVEIHDGGGIEDLRDVLCEGCGFERPPGPAHLTLAYFQAPDGSRAPRSMISAMERYRDWPVGEIRVDTAALTVLDLRTDYPKLKRLAELPLRPGNGGSPA